MSATQITTDAQEFGQHVKSGAWRLGLLVARNVKLAGRGRPKKKATEETVEAQADEAARPAKVTGHEFAKLSGISQTTISWYLRAWQDAALQGIVPDAAELYPGLEVELDVELLPSWSLFYNAVRNPEPEPPANDQASWTAGQEAGARAEAGAAAQAQTNAGIRMSTSDFRLDITFLNGMTRPGDMDQLDGTLWVLDRVRAEIVKAIAERDKGTK